MFLARLICDDVLGGFFFVGHVSKLMIWHTTFMINSFAHLIGSQNYSLDYTARGNLILAILTHGEGHHNYHHQFPKDYRNGIHWLDYDPTKWLIKFFSMLGLAYGLVETPSIEIEKALILTAEEKLRSRREKIEWGPNSDELPIWTREQVKKMSEDGRRLLIIDNLVYDVAKFMSKHPGGAKLLLMFNGADASEAFNGIYNLHSTAAQTLARTFLVARIEN